MTEYIMGMVYKRILSEYSPDMILVKGGDNALMVGSSWYENFKTLSKHNSSAKSKYSGIEKISVASLLCGEGDYHTGNIGIVSLRGQDSAVRIDFSYSQNYLSKKMVWKVIKEKEFNINSSDFKEALDQIVQIPKDELNAIIDQAVDDLQRVGCDFNTSSGYITVCYKYRKALHDEAQKDNPEIRRDEIKLSSEDVKQAYKEIVLSNLDTLTKFNDQITCALDTGSIDHSAEDWLMIHKAAIDSIDKAIAEYGIHIKKDGEGWEFQTQDPRTVESLPTTKWAFGIPSNLYSTGSL